MQIQLKQQHVEAAIKAYVAKAGITFPIDKIDFTAGRGKDGLTASIEMADPFLDDLPLQAEEPAPKAPRSQSFSKRETVEASEPKADKPGPVETPEPEPEEEEGDPQDGFAEPEEQAAEELPEPKKKASLFGG